ncbi:MAG: methyltransferase type 12 [Pseudomonadota bacterium]
MMSKESRLFRRQIRKNPLQVMALARSTRWLASEMVAGLFPENGPVIELGPGTGAFTREILARGIAPANLYLVEINPAFCGHLRATFPGVHVLETSADRLDALPVLDAQAVISGLPLLSMPPDIQNAILASAFERLAQDGFVAQFTYGVTPPVHRNVRKELGLTWTVSQRIWRNLPPARVYRFRAGQEVADREMFSTSNLGFRGLHQPRPQAI